MTAHYNNNVQNSKESTGDKLKPNSKNIQNKFIIIIHLIHFTLNLSIGLNIIRLTLQLEDPHQQIESEIAS